MVSARPAPWRFDLCGGHLVVDFANTVSARHTSEPIERLTSYADLVAFGEQSRVCPPAQAARLRALARRQPARARAELAAAVELRDALFAIVSSWAHREPLDPEDLAVVTDRAHRLVLDDQLAWACPSGNGLDTISCAVVVAALALFASPQRDRLRMCEADDCIWAFLDTTKNRSRRWCTMDGCGNRAKARRFHRRHRAA